MELLLLLVMEAGHMYHDRDKPTTQFLDWGNAVDCTPATMFCCMVSVHGVMLIVRSCQSAAEI